MAMRISAQEARAKFSEILGRVQFGKETVIVEKQRKPVAAVIDIDLYERWMAEREGHFEVFDEARSKNRDKSPEEVEKDIREAVSGVREKVRLPRGRRAQGGR